MPNDEFELLLGRCRERLSEINLRVPTLESAMKPPVVYSLDPPTSPPLKLLEPPASAPLTPKLDPNPALESAPPPIVDDKRTEEEFFPPPNARMQTPTPLRKSQPVPETQLETAPASLPASIGRRRAVIASVAAAVVAAGASGVWLARRPAPDLDIEVDGADAMTLRAEKGDILVAEGKELVDLSRDGRTLERRPLDAPVESLLWEQGSLWTADGRTATVIEHTADGRATAFTLNHVPRSLDVKDKYLWTSEKGLDALHEFLISRSILGALLQPLDSFELDGLVPETFTIDDSGTLWLVDEPTRRLYRLRLENGSYRRGPSAPLSPFVGPQGKLRSLTIESGAVWLLIQPGSGGRAALRRISLSRLDWSPA